MKLKTMNKMFLITSLLTVSPTVSKAESVYMCEPCPAGYACNNGVKTICPDGTYSGAVSTSCTKCPAGTYAPNEGSDFCGYPCLKNNYTILEVNVGMKSGSNYSCNTYFSDRTFYAGTKITNEVYKPTTRDYFSPSRGGCSVSDKGAPMVNNPGVFIHDYYASYTGIKYNTIKFRYNPNKNKIEVIEPNKRKCLDTFCTRYTYEDITIAELEATMCR